MPLDLKEVEQEVDRFGFSLRSELLTELRAARSALQRIVEKAKDLNDMRQLATQVLKIHEHVHDTTEAERAMANYILAITSAIEAASKVLERVRDS